MNISTNQTNRVDNRHTEIRRNAGASAHSDTVSGPDGRQVLPITRPSWLRCRLEQSAAFGLLIILSPVFALLAIAVRMSSPGPILYRQVRSGVHGRLFRIVKFRSMVADAEVATGAVWATKNDPRVTVIGYWLRRLHLDELPQLINIVHCEMSFVGPRPERPEIVSRLETKIPGYRHRLDVLPGVTGLAQVNLDPDDSIHSVKRKFELDVEYIFRATPLLDLRIVLTTLLKMGGIPKEYATAIFCLRRVPLVPELSEAESVDSWWDETPSVCPPSELLVLESVG